ncbi:MAG: enoyl-CoA hydratase-related protein [Armatimonadota bacterium]|nr:enoyl-CoA hydratase-related protein [Armatimonadota bacterium]MDR7463066.1 enoyl-CoA hydratase-related protein [Armatimonadota bacterium]MDR7469351.1 enoyl-CoA hydratase-related protein [Armatimonadota bacterium]MDR7475590.1 enoyl-CoA hydratase-related protein [Armatimonadota bacterium]
MSDFVELVRQDGIARITLNRPPLNILHSPMLEELTAALGDAAADSRVLVIGARGRAFCAGVDVGEHTPERAGPMLARFHRMCRRLIALDIPTVAAVHGAALGGGCEVVALCDIVVAARSASFGQPEIKLAAFPPVATAALAQVVGLRRAMALILTGESMTAEAAQAAGLVTTVVDDEALAGEVERVVGRLSALSGPALRLAKRAALEGFRRVFEEGLQQAERIYLHDLLATDDAREGIAAFLERRTPAWRHR